MSDSYRATYREEALELLADLEASLLELEKVPENMELIGRIFRALHTIKGSGAMFGFDAIALFVHDIESVYDRIRDGKMCVTKDIINTTLQAKDQIRLMLDEPFLKEGTLKKSSEILINALHQSCSAEEKATCVPGDALLLPEETVSSNTDKNETQDDNKKGDTYRIRFRPYHDILLAGVNPVLLLKELSLFGECTIVAQLDAVPCLSEANPEYCYTCWDIILTSDKGVEAIRDVFIFVEDSCELTIETIDCEEHIHSNTDYKKLGEILVERGDIFKNDLKEVLSEKKPIGEMLIEKGLVTTDKIESALVEQEYVRKKIAKSQSAEENASSIRVAAEKLDTLVNLVGELVTVQARFTQTASIINNNELNNIAEEVERLTSELRDNTLNIRMLPIGNTLGRFKRLIRDLSGELSKKIELTTDGAETELDKTVIEKLSDPLVHLIRNSIDHGIEPPDVRKSVGKPETGNIHLSAAHSGANVVIRIKDDGKGLSREAIFAKAVEKGFITHNADLTDKEIFNFIFYPGFSTAREVTNVSGRGVGMDVVKRAIESLRGSIDIMSEQGMGTTVSIKLPLTLAIIDGLLVAIGKNSFVLPLSFVEECVDLTRDDIVRSHGKNLANIRGEVVPYIRLRKEFNITGEPPAIEQIVIAGTNGDRVGFVVDNVIGEHQTVIKNLGRFYKNVKGVSGATILGDGSVALIVDVPNLVNTVIEKETSRVCAIGNDGFMTAQAL